MNLKIFVLHYQKLVQRKEHIIAQFEQHQITNYEFIDLEEELHQHFKTAFHPSCSKSLVSLSSKHFHAYQEISEKYDYALILEDDIILAPDFVALLEKYVNELPKDFDMLFIGDGCKLHIEKHKLIPNVNIYKKELYPTKWGGNGISRCSDSYIVSKSCATKLCSFLEIPSTLPIDWWMNDAARKCNLTNVFWAEPTIVTQGSQNGLFSSTC